MSILVEVTLIHSNTKHYFQPNCHLNLTLNFTLVTFEPYNISWKFKVLYQWFHKTCVFKLIATCSFLSIFSMFYTYFKGAFAVATTDKICGRNLSSKIPVDMNSIIFKLYVTFPTWPKGHIPQKFELSKWFL